MSKKGWIITLIAIASLIILTWMCIYFIAPPEVSSVNIKNNQENVDIYAPIKINFSRNPDPEQLKYITLYNEEFPDIPKYTASISGQEITLTMDQSIPMYPGKTYNLKIIPISFGGKLKGKSQAISFGTEDLSTAGELPSALQAKVTSQTNLFEDGKLSGFEFIAKLPVETATFVIKYANQNISADNSFTVDLYVIYKTAQGKNDLASYLKKQQADTAKISIKNYSD